MSAVEHDEIPRVSKEISSLSRFPFGANSETTGPTLDAILLNHLPAQPRAWTLYETYVEHASWIFGPIRRDEMIDEFLSPIYKAIKDTQRTGSRLIQSISPHRSAVLFFVLALGALVDLTLEPCESTCSISLFDRRRLNVLLFTLDNAESETYYHLGCACLSLRSVFDSPEVYTVQAVALMAAFQNWGGDGKHTMDSAVSRQMVESSSTLCFFPVDCVIPWCQVSAKRTSSYCSSTCDLVPPSDWSPSVENLYVVVNIVTNTTHLDRDGSRFNLDPKIVERRRHLFWELFSCEVFFVSEIYSIKKARE
jgi:hypothetical protein